MEMWDLYDKDKNMLERKIVRGEKLNKGEFHLVVNVWIENEKGELLVSQEQQIEHIHYNGNVLVVVH